MNKSREAFIELVKFEWFSRREVGDPMTATMFAESMNKAREQSRQELLTQLDEPSDETFQIFGYALGAASRANLPFEDTVRVSLRAIAQHMRGDGDE